MSDTPTARRWRALIDAQAASGLTNAAFAHANGVNRRTLAWWRSQLKKSGPPSDEAAPKRAFTELIVAQPDAPLVLSLDRVAASVIVTRETDLALLKRLLLALA
jgi:transposase-like protein